jgi:hypothetical protein
MNRVTLVLSALAASCGMAHASFLVNGSMTGAVQESAPSPWYNYQFSPDTLDVGGSFLGGAVLGAGMPASSDGGTFAEMAAFYQTGYEEAFAQDVTGLTPGQSYVLTFEYANCGTNLLDEQAAGFVTAGFVGSTLQSTPIVAFEGIGQQTWRTASFVLTASAANESVVFYGNHAGLGSPIISRMAVDGITLGVIPTPGTLGLAGLAGLAAIRRRR